MELQTEDGRTIFLTRGCRKELGRGPGLTWKDRTVSRRQIVLELPGDDASIQIVSKVYVEVVGANPICILRHGNAIQQVSSASASACDGQGIEFLEKGSKGLLRVGDKLSLSIKEPSFLTLKVGSDEDQEQKKGSFLKKVAFLEESAVQGAPKTAVVYDSTQLLKENNDLLDAWRSRKLAKKGEASDCKAKGRSFQSDGDDSVQRSTYAFNEDGNSRQENQTRNCEILEQAAKQSIPIVESTNTTVSPAKDEEEGIAEAVARRKRLSLKRQEAQSKQLKDLEWKKSKKVDKSEANTSKDNDEVDYREADHSEQMHNKLLQVDPVADLGFIVEGSEFDRFKGRKFDGRMLDWRIDKKRPDDNSEEEEKSSRSKGKGEKKIKPGVSKKSLHGRTEVEDKDWQGENEDEKLLVAKVKKPRKEIEVQTRSKYNSGSDSDKQLKMTKRTKNKLAQFRKTDEEEDDLTGFIVEDDEEVDSDQGKDDDEDKDEWIDDEASENSQDGNLKAAKCLKKITKPLCIYGRNCYRKNKEHLLQFRHPKS